MFAIQEVFTRVQQASTEACFSKWFVHPQSMPVPVDVPRGVERVIPAVRRDSPLSVVQDAGANDVDLVGVPAGRFSAMDVEDSLVTILDTFQRPDRCGPLNEALPRGSPAQEEGLQRLLRWGVKSVATLGEHIVLPF